MGDCEGSVWVFSTRGTAQLSVRPCTLKVMEQILILALAGVVGILSSARLTRLITQDVFPPAAWARSKWDNLTGDTDWRTLFHCHWCMAPWTTLAVGLWGYLSDLHISWWFFNVWLAASYIASMVVERDEVVDEGE